MSPDNGRAHGIEAAVVFKACVANKRLPVKLESGDTIHKGLFRIGHDSLYGITKGLKGSPEGFWLQGQIRIHVFRTFGGRLRCQINISSFPEISASRSSTSKATSGLLKLQRGALPSDPFGLTRANPKRVTNPRMLSQAKRSPIIV